MPTHSDEVEIFRKTASTHTKHWTAALELAAADIEKQWEALVEGRQRHQERLTEIGWRPYPGEEKVLRVNIGGSHANVHRSLISKEGKDSTFGALIGGIWDKRVPRDSDGRMVLDESPICVKHIIRTVLGRCMKPSVIEEVGSSGAAPADQEAYLLYISHVLGLAAVIPTFQNRMVVTGGSVIAGPLQLPAWSTSIRGWCPSSPSRPSRLDLLYRASRDGFSPEAFLRTTVKARETLTLIRVMAHDGSTDGVIGGYSNVPWRPDEQWTGERYYRFSGPKRTPSAFVFMLDSTGECQPVRWRLKTDCLEKAVHCYDGVKRPRYGPCFGVRDLRVNFGETSTTGSTISTGRDTYDVDEGSAFLALDGRQIADIEVFNVCRGAGPSPIGPVLSECAPWNEGISFGQSKAELVHKFGASTAGMLVEEHMALAYAQAELQEAEERADAAARALAAVYGPDVARGEDDPVVELSVRGMSVATLRSTLEVCPDSVFMAWFAERWRGGKGMDKEGRFKVDCDPTCFSKILDVMRMRKRAGWAENQGVVENGGSGDTIRIPVSVTDRASFEAAVNMYFPLCTGFIMNLVEGPSSATKITL